ncbi:hypothetical protein VQL36_18530 [Chengkuizengella sp. SCS-71B]|uniref:hypothetical protein n=1 Tax=Chengkuizengella sp. SCS-71B TaxID=3115290 RepID=UPI0032C22CC8
MIEEIIGSWSVDILYAPGAQGDDWFVLLPNGKGWFQSCNWGSCMIETFTWSLVDETIHIEGDKYYGYEGEVEYSSSHFISKIQLNYENTPSKEMMEVITFEKEFYFNTKYGLLSKEVSQSELDRQLEKYGEVYFVDRRYFKVSEGDNVFYTYRESVTGDIQDSYKNNPEIITELMMKNIRNYRADSDSNNEVIIEVCSKEEYETNI